MPIVVHGGAKKCNRNGDAVEGKAVDMGGYYHPNDELFEKAMRPSATLNSIIDAI